MLIKAGKEIIQISGRSKPTLEEDIANFFGGPMKSPHKNNDWIPLNWTANNFNFPSN